MKQEVYLKDLIDYLPRGRFLNIVRKICRDNNIKFPFAQESNIKGNIIMPDKVAFDKIYEHILVRFYNSNYKYSGLNNYPLYQILKKIYESQGWELPKKDKI